MRNGMVKLVKVHENARLPKIQKPGDAGADVYAVEDGTIPSLTSKKIRTGLKVAKYEIGGTFDLEVKGRSGLTEHCIFPIGGIIDSEYRGEIIIVLYNGSKNDWAFKVGDRIAQIIVYDIVAPNYVFVDESQVSETQRGSGGFGSTGQ